MTDLLSQMAQVTGLSLATILRIARSAPVRYKVYSIPKRSGGVRIIAQPAREVKFLQRALMQVFLQALPIHDAAKAYRPGISIKHNASIHAGAGPILKMDLREFFPSIRAADWRSYCEKTGCIQSPGEIEMTTDLMFHRPKGSSVLRLAIGAPSSPMLSNIIMHEFDSLVLENLDNNHIKYTRYADDLTFSAPRAGYMHGIVKAVAKTIRQLKSPRLEINIEKTTFITAKFGRRVTGLTLTNEGGVTVGRERKRILRATIYQYVAGGFAPSELLKLSGSLAFVNSVEPEYIEKLRRRYGDSVISEIFSAGASASKRDDFRAARLPEGRRR